MLNKRKSKWLKLLILGLIISLLVPSMVYGAEEAVTEPEIAATTESTEITPDQTPVSDTVETDTIKDWPVGPAINSDAACLIDVETGAILYNKNMLQKMYPASTTKIMTALIALENSSLDEEVVFTETGVSEAYSGSSNLYTVVGETFTMEECLYALLMKSANDFASQIAEHVAGNVSDFTQMMNARAEELGCVGTHFNNAHGLPDENHYSCAYDMALILKEAIKNEEFCKITGALSYTISASSIYAERPIASHNYLIQPNDFGAYYEYAKGGKTGYTDGAMYTLTAFAEKDGRTLISSTMHADDSVTSFIDAKALFEYGFNDFTNTVIAQGTELYSGGVVTLPNGILADGIETVVGETFTTDFGEMVEKYYMYDNHQVGYVSVTEASYLEELRLQEASEEAERLAQMSEQELLEEQITSTLEKPILEPINTELITVPHIIIAVFLILIAIGILLIIGTLILKAIRKRKSKKSRQRRLELERLREEEAAEKAESLFDLNSLDEK